MKNEHWHKFFEDTEFIPRSERDYNIAACFYKKAIEDAANLVLTDCLPSPNSYVEKWYKIQSEILSRAIRRLCDGK